MNDNPHEQDEDPDREMSPASGSQLNDPHSIEHSARSREKWKYRLEWGNFVVTVLTLIAVGVYASIAYRQWGEMIDSNGLTARGVVVAERNAKTAEEVARVSGATLKVTVEHSRLDQRAWLTVKTVTLVQPLAIGEKPTVKIEIFNSGKTPARDSFVAASVLSRRSLAQALSGKVEGDLDSRAVVGPSTSLWIDADSSEPIARQIQIDAIRDGQWTLYATGTVFYVDIFGRQHHTWFCFKASGRIDLEQRRFGACARGNSVD